MLIGITRSHADELAHRIAFARNPIKVPSPVNYPGEEYLQAFEETLRWLARWLEESA